MKTSRSMLVLAVITAAVGVLIHLAETAEARSISLGDNSFAAIAYSPSTGKYGLAYDRASRKTAEKDALADCGAEDAEIACWVEKGFCALALGNDKGSWAGGWSYGSGAGSDKAMRSALVNCRKRTSGAHIEVYLSSDGQVLWKRSLGTQGKREIWVSPDTFAAIAYSPSAKKYGLAYDHLSRQAAEKEALNKCGAADAQIVVWVNRGFCALAICDSGKAIRGVGWSGTGDAGAEEAAHEDCRKKTGGGGRIEVCLSSDGQILWEQSANTTVILPSGEVILPSGERIMPNGEVVLPSGKRMFPEGELTLPSGTKIMPNGEVVLPSGHKVPSRGSSSVSPAPESASKQ